MAERVAKNEITSFKLSVFVVLIMAELFFFTWCHVESVHMGYRIQAQLKQQTELKQLRKKLRLELAQLRTPKRIMDIASKRLGLVLPSPDQVIVIK